LDRLVLYSSALAGLLRSFSKGGFGVCRAKGAREFSPGRRCCALARPSLASGVAESSGRDAGLAESGWSVAEPWVYVLISAPL
jgi:hypothetical protein